MFRIASRITLVAISLGVAGCFVAPVPYDEPYYAGPGPPAVVLEEPRTYWVPRYHEEHVYVDSDRHHGWYARDRHERHDTRHHDRDHDHD